MIRFIYSLMLLLLTLLKSTPMLTHVQAEGANYRVDGYLEVVGATITWDDFFITESFQTLGGQADYVRFTGVTEWEFNTEDCSFARNGVVLLSQLYAQGVIDSTHYTEVTFEYVLDGGYGGVEWMGVLSIYPLPSYLDTWTGLVNNAMSDYYVSYASKPSRQQILSTLRAYDVHSGDVTLSIQEITSIQNQVDYDLLTFGLGSYPLLFQAKDGDSNTAQLTVNVHVIDDIAPEIVGPDETTTLLGMHESIEQIIERVWTVYDDFDSSPKLILLDDNYSENAEILNPEGYEIVLQGEDLSGNQTTRSLRIIVQDNIAPILTGLNYYTKGIATTISIADIQNQITLTDTDATARLIIPYDGFSTRQHQPGTYKIHFRAYDTAGNTSLDFVVTIRVEDDESPIFFVSGTEYHVNQGDAVPTDQLLSIIFLSANYGANDVLSQDIIFDSYSSMANHPGEYRFVVNSHLTVGSEQHVLTVIVHEIPQEPSWLDNILMEIKNFFSFDWLFA